jgi:Uma2 family endonuclease
MLSPGNRPTEMLRKFRFYERYGVQEYYVYDPDEVEVVGWWRRDDKLVSVDSMDGWVNPLLQIRFVLGDTELEIYRPDGRQFLTMVELEQRAVLAEERARKAEELLAQYRDRYGDLTE